MPAPSQACPTATSCPTCATGVGYTDTHGDTGTIDYAAVLRENTRLTGVPPDGWILKLLAKQGQ